MTSTTDNDILVGGIYSFMPIESERYYPGIVEVIKDYDEGFAVNVIDGVRKGGGIIYVMKGSRFHKWMSLMDDPKHDNTAETTTHYHSTMFSMGRNTVRNVIETTCAIFLVVLFIALCFSPCETPYDLKEQTYIVESGDCLWRIADTYCPRGIDKREYICLIQERNNLEGCTIYPGQRLIIFTEQ